MKLLMSFVLVCPFFLVADERAELNNCKIDIVTPKTGTSVGQTDTVNGTAKIPRGKHLWIFAHRRGLALYWPQGGGAPAITDEKWEVLGTFGEDRDNGAQFEIVAVVVDDKTNDELGVWVIRAEATGRYPGMKLPASVVGCNIPKAVVTRSK